MIKTKAIEAVIKDYENRLKDVQSSTLALLKISIDAARKEVRYINTINPEKLYNDIDCECITETDVVKSLVVKELIEKHFNTEIEV